MAIDPQAQFLAKRQSIREHRDYLVKLADTAYSTVSKFLLLGNGGGVTATLAYLSILKNGSDNIPLRVAICLFVIGFILSGLLNYTTWRGLQNLCDNWDKLAERHFKSNASYITVIEDQNTFRNRVILANRSVGWPAAICLVIGTLIGLGYILPITLIVTKS